jgi:hypothetical protein
VHCPTMPQHIGYIALLVRDYDEAISYFVEKLGFMVAEDTDLGGGKRWILVAPPGRSRRRLCWQRRYLRTNCFVSGIRQVAASSYSCTLMISGATTKPIAQEACYSARNPAKNSMGSLRSSKISMETIGT